MHLHYFYDTPPDSNAAALTQALQTLHAACAIGACATLYLRDAAKFDVKLLHKRHHLEDNARFSVKPFFGRFTRRAYPRALHQLAQRNEGFLNVFMTRGESGLPLITAADASQWFRILEVHRLCFVRLIEKRTGKIWTGTGPRRFTERRMAQREQHALDRADALVAVSPAVQRAAVDTFHFTGPSMVLPSGVAIDNVPFADDASRDIDVIYAGKLDPAKGVDIAVRAMAHLPDKTLSIVGGTPEQIEAGRALAAASGVSDRIVWHGRVDPAAVAALLRRARVGLCPLPRDRSVVSQAFSSPMKILEYMAAGAVVVASDLPSVREIVEHDQCAILVPPNDPAALAAAIQRALDDPALRHRLRAAARARAEHFAWPVRARRLLEFIGQHQRKARVI